MVGRGSGDVGKSNYIVRVDWEKIALDMYGARFKVGQSGCAGTSKSMW